MWGMNLELAVLTIAGMSHHSGYAFSCTSCIPFGIWYGCALKGLHLVQPFLQKVNGVFKREWECCRTA
jgi:hypothetical protein